MKSIFCLASILLGKTAFGSDAMDDGTLYTPPVCTPPFDVDVVPQDPPPPAFVEAILEALPTDPTPSDLPQMLIDLQALDAAPVPSFEAITAKLLELIQWLNTLDEKEELSTAYSLVSFVCLKRQDIMQNIKDLHKDLFFEFAIKHLRMSQFFPSPTVEMVHSFIKVGTKHLMALFSADYDLMKAAETHCSPQRCQIETLLLHIKKSFEFVNIRTPTLSKIIFQNYQPLLQDLVRIDLKDPDKGPQLDVPLFVNKGYYLFKDTIQFLMAPTTDVEHLQIKYRIRQSAWNYDDLILRHEELMDGVPRDLKTLVFTIKTLKFPEE